MGEPSPERRRRLSIAGRVGAFGGAYLCLLYAGVPLQRQIDRLHDWWWDGYGAWPSGGAVHRVIDLLGHGFMAYFAAAFVSVFVASVIAAPLAFLGRTLARARVRAGSPDPIAPARRWVAARPGWVRGLTVVPPALWSLFGALEGAGPWGQLDQLQGYEKLGVAASFGIVGVLATALLTGVLRAALRALVAPVVDESEPQRAELASDEIGFGAVAITGETRTAVGAMIALDLGALLLALSSPRAFHDPRIVAGLVAYAVVALGGAALFRHASQVAVGVDGVLVKGTSRTRFFAYRDLDAARVDGGDLELVRGDRVVLRLQLHGEDASKRSAVLTRIRDAIDRVKEGRGAVSAQLVASATRDQLVRAAGGAADYRGAALTRDQLWALVEGPEIEEGARCAAAEALARTSGPEEKARLRVAAEHCAAPAVRVAIEKLAEEALAEEPAAARAGIAAIGRSA